ncbi:MAG: S8 family serine peptidase, partial [Bacteroidota bacterium]
MRHYTTARRAGLSFCIFLLTFLNLSAQSFVSPAAFESNRQQYNDSRAGTELYLLAELSRVPDAHVQREMAAAGVRVLAWKVDHQYWLAIRQSLSADKLSQLGVHALARIPIQHKVSRRLLEVPNLQEGESIAVAIQFHESVATSRIQHILRKHELKATAPAMMNGRLLLTRIKAGQQWALGALPLVAYVQEQSEVEQPLNHETRASLRANVLHRSPESFGLRGKGVTVGVGDGGTLGDHIDFTGRVIDKANGTYNSYGAHGDVTSGIIAGGGVLNPRHAGMAPECTLITQKTANIINLSGNYWTEHRMVLTNNSYGSVVYCKDDGVYNYKSVDLDWRANEYPKQLHVYAAGNGGGQQCGEYPTGFATILPYTQSAKNNLVVGSVDEQGNLAANSSKGPTYDGRIKPELVGVGVNVTSTGRDFNYQSGGGTSAAAPSVTGTLALLYQKYRELNNDEDPDAALIKSIACNTASDLGQPGPDFSYGFGMINARRASQVIEAQQYVSGSLAQGEKAKHLIQVPAGVSQLKVMLYWSDVEAEQNATIALVNDLDLTLTDPVAANWQPWVLSQSPEEAAAAATRGTDQRNNVEQITLDNTLGGTYTIEVSGTTIPMGTQPYYITYDFVYPELELTYPYGGEHLTGGEAELIHWDAEPNNTSTFKLEYSISNGTDWQLIAEGIAADVRSYWWTLPEIEQSDAWVRITKEAIGDVDLNPSFSILPQVQLDSATAICEGYATLRWNAMPDVDNYRLLTLGAQGMVPLMETQDSFAIIDNASTIGARYWYGLEASLPNGRVSQRSVALSYQPESNEVCPWTDDVKLNGLSAATVRGRANTSLSLGEERIAMQIKNVSNAPLSNVDAMIRVNGVLLDSERIENEIASGDTLDYTMQQTV